MGHLPLTMIRRLIVGLLLCVSCAVGAVDHLHDRAIGSRFMLAFMQNEGSSSLGVPLEIFVMAADSGSSIMVKVEYYMIAPFELVSINYTVSANKVKRISVARSFMLKGSGIERRGISVSSVSGADFVLYGVNKDKHSVDGFIAYPVDKLGNEYYAICYGRVTPGHHTEIAVAGVHERTTLKLVLNGSDARLQFSYDGRHYQHGDTVQVQLNMYDVFQIQCQGCDLTGTRILADKPVSAYSGNIQQSVPYTRNTGDHLVEQLIPLTSWGSEHVVVANDYPLTAGAVGDEIIVIAFKDSTSVTIKKTARMDAQPSTMSFSLSAGKKYMTGFGKNYYLQPGHIAHISSTKPVQVAQFSRSPIDSAVVKTDPSMTLIPGFEQAVENYSFSIVNLTTANAQHYAIIIIRGRGIPLDVWFSTRVGNQFTRKLIKTSRHDETNPVNFDPSRSIAFSVPAWFKEDNDNANVNDFGNIFLDGTRLSFDPQDGIDVGNKRYRYMIQPITGMHSLTTNPPLKMAVRLFGVDEKESYGFSAGHLLTVCNAGELTFGFVYHSQPCKETLDYIVKADFVDNDCDYFIDEDACRNYNDGSLNVDNKDCKSDDALSLDLQLHPHDRIVGHEFMVMFMENRGSPLGPDRMPPPLEIFITAADQSSLVAIITAPGLGLDIRRNVSSGVVERIEIDLSARMVGTSRDRKGLLIETSSDAIVYGVNKALFSVDSFVGIPVDMLGREYYSASFHPPQVATQLGVVGVRDNTEVTIRFIGGGNPIEVLFESFRYRKGDTLRFIIDRFDTVQLQCSFLCDLTGTFISASAPIAAFSGNVRAAVPASFESRDHLVEQLIPFHAWGTKYPVRSTPHREQGDFVMVIAHYPQTSVLFYQTNIAPDARVLNQGDFATFLLVSGAMGFVTADKPVMVVQLLKSQQTASMLSDPSMIIIPAQDQHSNTFRFSTTEGVATTYINWLIITIEDEYKDGLRINGAPATVYNWTSVGGTNYVGGVKQISNGTHLVNHVNPNVNFGLILNGVGDRESYAMAVGMKLQAINPCIEIAMTLADQVDNDCDQFVDEEICDGRDNDRDGRVDEDCSQSTTTSATTTTTASATTKLIPVSTAATPTTTSNASITPTTPTTPTTATAETAEISETAEIAETAEIEETALVAPTSATPLNASTTPTTATGPTTGTTETAPSAPTAATASTVSTAPTTEIVPTTTAPATTAPTTPTTRTIPATRTMPTIGTAPTTATPTTISNAPTNPTTGTASTTGSTPTIATPTTAPNASTTPITAIPTTASNASTTPTTATAPTTVTAPATATESTKPTASTVSTAPTAETVPTVTAPTAPTATYMPFATTTTASSDDPKDIYDEFYCGTDPVEINCNRQPGDQLQIIQIHYGRISYPEETTCGVTNPQMYFEDQYVDRICTYESHYNKTAAWCDREYSCIIELLDYQLTACDLGCPETSLYLHVTYRCIPPFEYQFNDVVFGATSASSEEDNALISSWRKPYQCVRSPFFSPTSCEAVCNSPFALSSSLCPDHASKCLVSGADFSSSNVFGWCPDRSGVDCAYIDTFLGDTYRVTGVVLQGGRRFHGWVSKFSLYYSIDGEWNLAPTSNQVIDGNTDSYSTILIRLVYPQPARYMRLKVVEFGGVTPYVHIAYIHHHAAETCPLLTLSNTELINYVASYGQSVMVRCEHPFETEAGDKNFTIVCGPNLQWGGVQFCTERSCGPFPEELNPNSYPVGEVFVHETEDYICPNTTSLRHKLFYCDQITYEWTRVEQCCDACLLSNDSLSTKDTCYSFPQAINAAISSTLTCVEGNLMRYECLPEHYPHTSLISQCTLDGEDLVWTVDPVVCTAGVMRLVLTLNGTEFDAGLVVIDTLGPIGLGTVSGDKWDTRDATVLCRQVNKDFSYTGVAMITSQVQLYSNKSSLPLLMANFDCEGSEHLLLDCPHTDIIIPTMDLAAAYCVSADECDSGCVRIHNPSNDTHGLAQICYANTWGSISSRGWDLPDATVFCTMLGFSTVANLTAIGNLSSVYTTPELVGPRWITNLDCVGDELTIFSCLYGPITERNTPGAGANYGKDYTNDLAFIQCDNF